MGSKRNDGLIAAAEKGERPFFLGGRGRNECVYEGAESAVKLAKR